MRTFFSISQLGIVISVMSLRIPIASFNTIQRAFVQRKLNFRPVFLSTLAGTIISGICGVASAYAGFGVWALVTQYLSNSIISTIVLYILSEYHFHFQFSCTRLKPLYKFGWKILAASMIAKLYDESRSLIIGKKYTDNSLSYYNKGVQIPQMLVSNINTSISNVMLPVMAQMQNNQEELRKTLRKSLQLSMYLVAPMMVGLIVVARPVVTVLYTDKWLDVVPYMQLFALAYVVLPVQDLNQQAIRAVGRSDISLVIEMVKKIFGILTIVAAVAMFDTPIAVAASFTVYCAVALIINLYPCGKLLGYGFFRQMKDMMTPIILSVAMGVVIYPIQFLIHGSILLLVCQMAAGCAFYILISAILKIPEYIAIFEKMKSVIKGIMNQKKAK